MVNEPGPDTLIIETAITDLFPAKAAGSGTITVEGRLRDGNNGKLAANFRDTMKDKMAFMNIDPHSWHGGSEANLDEMAANIAQIINAKPGTIVSQPSQLKLINC